MSRYVPNTYRNRRAARIALTVALSLVLACVIAAVALFFGLKKYVVYTQDGKLRLEIPWLEDTAVPSAASS
ncbi:MAG: hypothetical protein LBD92_02905 [Oscillospiraceae bacterium]|nr:hypothetical protein [Oscillospiraceae bacterium]